MNGKYIVKSGTDFRQFSVITLDFNKGNEDAEGEGEEAEAGGDEDKDKKKEDNKEEKVKAKVAVEVEMVEVTEKYAPDNELAFISQAIEDRLPEFDEDEQQLLEEMKEELGLWVAAVGVNLTFPMSQIPCH